MPYVNTDLGFYGGTLGSFGNYGGGAGVGFPLSYLSGGAGVGGEMAALGMQLPLTPTGFFQTYMPEVGKLTPGLRQSYMEFLGTPAAGTMQGVSEYMASMRTHPDVLRSAYETELGGLGAVLAPDEVGDEIGLSDWVRREMEAKGSRLSNIYGGLGVSSGVVTEDLRRLLAGEQSAVGGLMDVEKFGKLGGGTEAARQALFAQLAGTSLVQTEQGVFNPFSADLMTDYYKWGGGTSPLAGKNLMNMATGLMSLQDLDITGQLAGAFEKARQSGAYMGEKGTGLARALAAISGNLSEPMAQTPDMARWLDKLWGSIDRTGVKRSSDIFRTITQGSTSFPRTFG